MYKVLIVEDECIIRNGIVCLVKWKDLNCEIAGQCANAIEALEFLEINPVDIVITDIVMPQINGLKLCEQINLKYPNTKIIILSSYSDFSYAQAAIKNKVVDYILKSNFINELPASVSKICSLIKKENEFIDNAHLSQDSIDKFKIMVLRGVIEDSSYDLPTEKECLELLQLNLKTYHIIISEIEHTLLNDTKDNCYNFIKNVYESTLNEIQGISLWIDANTLLTIVNFETANTTLNLQKIHIIFNNILLTLKKYMSFNINVGVSKSHNHISQIKVAYHEAFAALNKTFKSNSISIYEDELDIKKIESIESRNEIAQNIIKYIQSKNKLKYSSYISDIFEKYLSTANNYDKIKFNILSLISNCFSIIEENNLNIIDLEQLENSTNSNILESKSLNSLFTIMQNWGFEIMRLHNSINFSSNNLVTKVNNYIKEHYSSTIKLNDIASELHVNSSYLSRLYKKQTGDSIINAVNKFRVIKAKELLTSGDYLISEIGALVGIQDPAYFTNIFTKYVGVSPKNYKQIN